MAAYPDALRGMDFLELAEEFYQAYLDLPVRQPPSWPRYFVLCHAIELALKAYLAHHGSSHRELTGQGVRHNLGGLMGDAANAGLSISVAVRSDLQLLGEAHSKFWSRYPRGHGNPSDAGKPVFLIEQFEGAARELLRAVATSIRGPNYKLYVNY